MLVAALAAVVLSGLGVRAEETKKADGYPLDTCVVSGEKLGSMGDAHTFVEGNQEVQLCCASCQKDFNKDKKANLAKIAEAAKKVKAYPLTTCIVSGEALESSKAVGVVYEGREYDFCCKSCVKDFKKDPAKFAKKLDEAAAKPKS